jgi:ABC-type multidrug transport system, ATPase component
MEYAVQCKDLWKEYKKIMVLEGVSFNIEKNKIYGLLGRNGAGKTTLLNIISTQIFKSSGELKVFGEESYENQKVLDKICYIKDRMTYMGSFKVRDIFKFAAYFFDNWDEQFKEDLVEKFELDVHKKYKDLSKGMEAMVGIIVGLASRAPLTIFDEAYLGLDAAARQLFYDILLEDYMDNPRTIIFSTHHIDEVSNMFEKIIILHKGRVLLEDELDNVKNKAFQIIGREDQVEEIVRHKNILNIQDFGKAKKIFLFDELKKVEIEKLIFTGAEVKQITLQEAFIHLTDKKF